MPGGFSFYHDVVTPGQLVEWRFRFTSVVGKEQRLTIWFAKKVLRSSRRFSLYLFDPIWLHTFNIGTHTHTFILAFLHGTSAFTGFWEGSRISGLVTRRIDLVFFPGTFFSSLPHLDFFSLLRLFYLALDNTLTTDMAYTHRPHCRRGNIPPNF